MTGYAELPVLPVGQALDLINSLFTQTIGQMRVVGEVANYKYQDRGYAFFDLKDEAGDARVGCFVGGRYLTTPLEDGMRIEVIATPGIYVKNGQFRFTITGIKLEGEGTLQRAFKLLKEKLDKEGLFAQERKREIPALPERIGIVSSYQAAGFGDFMRIARQRSTMIEYVLADVAVQGMNAEQEIVSGIDYLNSHYDLDVLVVIRGGGSMEDLHAFNSEVVARAIVRSKVPVVVGVGHEQDVTIADFCADLRAATPSNAAQLVVPDQGDLVAQLDLYKERINQRLTNRCEGLSRALERVESYCNQVIAVRLTTALQTLVRTSERLAHHLEQGLVAHSHRLKHYATVIEAYAPQRVLERGYSLTYGPDGNILRTAKNLKPGDSVTTRLAAETITSVISES